MRLYEREAELKKVVFVEMVSSYMKETDLRLSVQLFIIVKISTMNQNKN